MSECKQFKHYLLTDASFPLEHPSKLVLGQVWCLIVSFPDLCRFSYFVLLLERNIDLLAQKDSEHDIYSSDYY